MLRIAMLSKWHVHAEGYARDFINTGKATVTCVWDEEPERGKPWAESLGCAFEPDLDKLLAREDVDAVCVTTPTTMHREVMLKAAAAKKHIFTEKALAVTVAECEEIAKAIRDNGVTFTISMPFKMSPIGQYAKQLIESGIFGKISQIRFRNAHDGVSGNWLPKYWFDGSKAGGGAMMDLGCHPMYFLADVCGKPKRVTALFNELYGTGLDENAVCTIEFENGIVGVSETSFVAYQSPVVVEIHGTDASFISVNGEAKLWSKKFQGIADMPVNPSGQMKAAAAPIPQFVDACLNGTGSPKGLGLEDAIALTVLLENAYRSDKENRTVVL